jgi:hypothetical protein
MSITITTEKQQAIKMAAETTACCYTFTDPTCKPRSDVRLATGCDNGCVYLPQDIVPHGFFGTLALAYSYHLPVQFGPQHLWLLVLQGVAQHIDKHKERLQPKIMKKVTTDEKQQVVEIRRDGPIDVAEVIDAMTKAAQALLPDDSPLSSKPFSCSRPEETTAIQATFMNAVHHYVRFVLYTFCGFPSVKLEGTLSDWQDLQARVAGLHVLDEEDAHFNDWLNQVWSILAKIVKFVETPDQEKEKEFWNSMVRQNNMSGRAYLDGWLLSFVPYLCKKQQPQQTLRSGCTHGLTNRWQSFLCAKCNKWTNADDVNMTCEDGVCPNYCDNCEDNSQRLEATWVPTDFKNTAKTSCDHLPDGLTRTPFKWVTEVGSSRMLFVTGFSRLPTRDDGDGRLHPSVACRVEYAS